MTSKYPVLAAKAVIRTKLDTSRVAACLAGRRHPGAVRCTDAAVKGKGVGILRLMQTLDTLLAWWRLAHCMSGLAGPDTTIATVIAAALCGLPAFENLDRRDAGTDPATKAPRTNVVTVSKRCRRTRPRW
jgi:hypothetical protein